MAARHAPDRGDIVWVDFDPQAGHEQAGRRPALIVSPQSYNQKVGLALLCPITNQRKGYPFEVPLPKGLTVAGVVLADQVKSMDLPLGVHRASLRELLDRFGVGSRQRLAVAERLERIYRLALATGKLSRVEIIGEMP